MKFERTSSFDRDWRQLNDRERKLFREQVGAFHDAAEQQVAQPGAVWPKRLRVKAVTGAPNVWEMTWSFAGPDGRATFEWIAIDGEPAIRWRRIGGHDVFKRP